MTRNRWARRAKRFKDDQKQEFYECIKDIMEHPVVQKMKKFPHHCATDCYQHCLNVAYYNYQICKMLGLNAEAAARAGMLHDLFLYDWREHTAKTGDHFHAMTHPRRALRRAEKYFALSPLEKDIILKHMWPVTFFPPKYLETYVICFTDKYCGACEIANYYSGKVMPRRIKLPFGYKHIYRLASKLAPAKAMGAERGRVGSSGLDTKG